ncbi:hypothetical protein PLICRDRAFT_134453 [Plicaturopsis crispa FD-325 SS-3]|nr:hypothetical protein PLICRDRAFT_134453 [Plicaturopsis crispa FD-325 SS-3]
MAPYLETVKSFADVPITDAGVDTAAFLEAAEGLNGLFDLLGSSAFTVVQSDIKSNITKVRTYHLTAPGETATLQSLVTHEFATQPKGKRTASEGLMWLLRGLSFTAGALERMQADKKVEMKDAFAGSYEGTLKKFHNFVVKGIFAVALKAVPYRADFYTKLATDPAAGTAPDDAAKAKLDADLDKCVPTVIFVLQSSFWQFLAYAGFCFASLRA